MRAEPHLVVVDGEVDKASAELEKPLTRVAVALVLLDGVVDGLLGQAVLQLERGDGQAVHEQAEVEGELGVVLAEAELACHAEAVIAIQDFSPVVARRRRAVHQVDLEWPVLDAVAEHVDRSTPGDLPLEAGQELAARLAVLTEVQ